MKEEEKDADLPGTSTRKRKVNGVNQMGIAVAERVKLAVVQTFYLVLFYSVFLD